MSTSKKMQCYQRTTLMVIMITCLEQVTGNCQPSQKLAIEQTWPRYRMLIVENSTENQEWGLYRDDTNEYIETMPNYNINNKFVLKPFMIGTGVYRLVSNTEICYFKIREEIPIAIINGGSLQQFTVGQSISLSGEKSLDYSVASLNISNLKYKWSCMLNGTDEDICKTANSFEVTIEDVYSENNNTINISLIVTTWDNVSSLPACKIVDVLFNVITLRIMCEKNCPPHSTTTVSYRETILSVVCEQNCNSFIENYDWIVWNENFENILNTSSKQLHITPHVLFPSKTYFVEVNARGENKGMARLTLNVFRPVTNIDCKINPDRGLSIITKFLLKCWPVEKDSVLQIYRINEYEEFMLLWSNYADLLEEDYFILPHLKKLYIRQIKTIGITNIYSNFTIINVDVLSSSKLSKIEYENVFKQFGEFSHIDAIEMQIFEFHQILINDLTEMNRTDEEIMKFVNKANERILYSLANTPIYMLRQILYISNIIVMLQKLHKQNSLYTDSIFTDLCLKLGQRQFEFVAESRYQQEMSDEVIQITVYLYRCFDKFFVSKTNNTIESTGKFLNKPSLDYLDFEEMKVIEYMEYIAKNYKQMSSLTSLALVKTLANGENYNNLIKTTTRVMIFKNYANLLLESNSIDLKHFFKLEYSQDLQDYKKQIIEIVITVWQENWLKWHKNTKQISTSLLNIDLSTSTIVNFKEPHHLFLNLNDKFNPKIIKETIHFSRVSSTYTVHSRRIIVRSKQAIMIHFHNIGESAFSIVLSQLRHPTLEDFDNASIINKTNNFIYFYNSKNFNIWIFFAVKPAPNYTTNTYYASFITGYCFNWNYILNNWFRACVVGERTTFDSVHCKCHHFSTIAARLENVNAQINERMNIDFTMELQMNYIIVSIVCSLFFLYCLCLLYDITLIEREIYFLADNLREDRYAYLLIVFTGKQSTTSNIVVKLIGNDRRSIPHVLNYPDPKHRLLKKCANDFFILTTNLYLGNLHYIELWFDSIGVSEAWYCRKIIVYDLQTHNSWFFNINTRFSVSNGLTHVRKPIITYQELAEKENKKRKFYLFDHMHTWNLNYGKRYSLSYFKRLTMILSTILTTMTFSLFLFGVPKLRLFDIFDYFGQYTIFGYTCLAGFLSGLLSFSIHIILAWLFRLSNENSKIIFNKRIKHQWTAKCIAWLILIGLLISSMSLLLTYGFWVPFTSSYLWLTSCTIGLILNIVVFQNITSIILKQFIFYKTHIYDFKGNLPIILHNIEVQRLLLYKNFGNLLLRPYLLHLYNPLRTHQIKRKESISKAKDFIIGKLRDLVIFFIYLILLYSVMTMNKASLNVLSNDSLKDLVTGRFLNTHNFESVSDVAAFIKYLNETFIMSTQPSEFYGQLCLIGNELEKEKILIDCSNILVGVARLRQLLTKPNVCKIPKIMDFLNQTCRPEFSRAVEQTGSFTTFWANTSNRELKKIKHVWKYKSSSESGSWTTYGKIFSYPGGGYISPLGHMKRTSLYKLDVYKRFWFRRQASAYFVEFLTYNANYNIFNAVTILLELSRTGYYHRIVRVEPVRMLFGQADNEIAKIVIYILFIIMVLFLLLVKLIYIIKHLRTFLKDFWLLIDLFIILTTITSIFLFWNRFYLVENYLKKLVIEELKTKGHLFVNYFELFDYEYILVIFAATLLFMSTIRLWELLRFGKLFRMLEHTILIACKPYLHTFMCYIMLLTAFSIWGFVIFGNSCKGFTTFKSSIMTILILTLLLRSKFDNKCFENDELEGYGYFYFCTFAFIIIVFFFFYKTIIIYSYAQAKLLHSYKLKYTLKTLTEERCEYLYNVIKYKFKHLRGGNDEEIDEEEKQIEDVRKLVRAKSNEFYYINSYSIALYKLITMKYITKCILYRKAKLIFSYNGINTELIIKLCHSLLWKKHKFYKHIFCTFFKSPYNKIGWKNFQFVYKKRFERMDFIANKILTRHADNTYFYANVFTQEEPENLVKAKKCKTILLETWQEMDKINLKLFESLELLDEIVFKREWDTITI